MHIECNNGFGETPWIRFDEEDRAALSDGSSAVTGTSSITKPFDDPDKAFPLLDPATGQPTGAVMTHGAVYATLFSLYIHSAKERDEAQSGV